MAKFRMESVAALARQMKFVPQESRRAQLDAAEELVRLIDPGKAYPLDFIVFRITGYHPNAKSDGLLTGLALLHDLGLLIEQASDGLDLVTSASAEPVLSIDDVRERLSVTSKTIQRWRRRGLVARRYAYADGKRRVGFLLSSVEWFVGRFGRQVASAANITRMEPPEQAEIVRRARRLAVDCHCCEEQLARRIARYLHRSPLAIVHILRKHDQEHPAQAILPLAARPISAEERSAVLKAHRGGEGVFAIARRLARPAAAVGDVIVEHQLSRLGRHKIRFHDDTLYHQPAAAMAIEAICGEGTLPDPADAQAMRIPRDLPPYLLDLYRIPLLGAARERALFLKYNFHKFQFAQAWRRLEPANVRRRDLKQLEAYRRLAIETKNQIVAANLRLVVSVARKHVRPGAGLMELVSEGNLILMRAVDGFDVLRGRRFSTYATLALMKGFARAVGQMLGDGRCSGDPRLLADVPDHRTRPQGQGVMQRDEIEGLLGRLDERERRIVSDYYGLRRPSASTYEQVARRLGLSKERVRQIEQSALTKLRLAAGQQV